MKLTLPERIETARLGLHRLRPEDASEIFFSYASKPEATRFMAWPTHESLKDTRAFLNYATQAWEEGTDFSYAIRTKEYSRLIGSFGVLHDDGKIQFGYIFSPSQWGSGFATEVCKTMMSLLSRIDGVYRIGTFVDAENESSSHVLVKSGLVEEARLTKWFRFVNQEGKAKDCILYRLP